ncbi:MAG: hypothetical protein ABW252_05005 [Polyangiales bacterium]
MRRFSVVMLLSGLLGCAQILDIEERKSGDDGVVTADSALCRRYCAESTRICTPERGAQLFETEDQCLGVCATYTAGSENDSTGNTLNCRLNALENADSLGEFQNTCAPASAGGGGGAQGGAEAVCGTNCEGYCALYEKTCQPIPDCVNRCKALPDVGAVNSVESYKSGADTLQCRISHVAAAASAKRKGNEMERMLHCRHSGIKSEQVCDVADTATRPYSCDDYCKLVTNACTDSAAVYENVEQCKAVCAKLPAGKASDLMTNTLRCRREFGYLALQGTPAQFCTNAGPAPGLCGAGKCDSYCLLAKAGCGQAFGIKFGIDEAALGRCEADCRNSGIQGTGPNGTYAVKASDAQRGRTLSCRLLRIERVLGGDVRPQSCAAALGDAFEGASTDCM